MCPGMIRQLLQCTVALQMHSATVALSQWSTSELPRTLKMLQELHVQQLDNRLLWCSTVSACLSDSLLFVSHCLRSSFLSSCCVFLSLCHCTLTLPHSHTLLITCTCCYDLTKETQDKDFSYSFSDSLSATVSLLSFFLSSPLLHC